MCSMIIKMFFILLPVFFFGLLQNVGIHCLKTEAAPPYPDMAIKQITTPLFGSFNDNVAGWYSKFNSAPTMLNGITQKINDLIDSNSNTMSQITTSYFKNADIGKFSPQNLQIISDMFKVLEPNYMYNKMLAEKQIHQDSYVAAYRDLENAMNILSERPKSNDDISTQQPGRTNERLLDAKNHILSAVQHLRDSCPLCRALKHVVDSDENDFLLPFVTSASLDILKHFDRVEQ